MSKDRKKEDPYYRDNQKISAIQNQINKSYQSGVLEDKLSNNKSIYTYNNQSK
ncbi:MAG TPA: hypothetical protein VK044_00685 [Virgibacillus sp.]|nr:hypothetical protein [Virgibacillus sp.]